MPLTLEREQIESARAGGSGLERLISDVWPEAYRIAYSILRDRGLSEDAAQDACVAVARSLPTLKNPDAFRAWVYKIIVSQAIATARRRPSTRELGELADQGINIDQSDALDLYNALATLPIVQRSAIILHYYAGLNSVEIGAATGQPSNTVRFHLMLARRTLHQALSTTNVGSVHPPEEALSDVD
jgi:RNA polymerase sigma-70 factor (ECF subfamily)